MVVTQSSASKESKAEYGTEYAQLTGSAHASELRKQCPEMPQGAWESLHGGSRKWFPEHDVIQTYVVARRNARVGRSAQERLVARRVHDWSPWIGRDHGLRPQNVVT